MPNTRLYSHNADGMCNRFLAHYALKQFCQHRGFDYRCGIDFKVQGFPCLPAPPVTAPDGAICLRGQQLRKHGGLMAYPFEPGQAYALKGMPGVMKCQDFPGIVKRPLQRRFPFKDLKPDLTQFQVEFVNSALLAEFTPAPAAARAVDEFILAMGAGIPVGIHRRRGDYARWNEGRYLDSDAQILEKIEVVRSLAPRPVQFVLCTDEPGSAGSLASEPDVHPANATREFEWLALQRTRLIIGAVSTFTITAAGFSGLPYLFANEIVTAGLRDRVRKWLAE